MDTENKKYRFGSFTQPGFAGDNINNPGLYYPDIDTSDSQWRMQTTHGNHYARSRTQAKKAYTYQGMFPFIASSGPQLLKEICLNPEPFLNHSLRLSQNDEPFLSMQGSAKLLAADSKARIFAQSYAMNAQLGQLATQHIQRPGTYIIRPDMREEYIRAVTERNSAMRGTVYTDSVFEQSFWKNLCYYDQSFYVYGGPHAWSYNAPQEKAVQAGIQYAYSPALERRNGRNSDALDVYGRELSIVELAHETARGLIDVTTTKASFQGGDHAFRFPTAAAEYLVRSMYNHMDLNNLGHRYGEVHKSVLAHRANLADQEQFQALDALVLPWIAETSNNPQFMAVLNADPALNQYWEEHVLPTRPTLTTESELITRVLGYEVPGGYISNDLRQKVQNHAQPGAKPHFIQAPKLKSALGALQNSATTGQKEDILESAFAPQIFDPDLFDKLGDSNKPSDLSAAQEATKLAVASIRHDGTPRSQERHTLLYIDRPQISQVAQNARATDKITDIQQIKASKSPLDTPSRSFEHAIAKPAQSNFQTAIDALFSNTSWKEHNQIGNILPLSVVADACTFTGKDPETKFDKRLAISAGGSVKDIEAITTAAAHRLITADLNGLVLPSNFDIDEMTALLMSANLLAVTGKAKRGDENTNYVAAFFEDRENAEEPTKLDIADLMIKTAMIAKPLLEKATPDNRRRLYSFMAQILHVYDCAADSPGLNVQPLQNVFNGEPKKESIFDFNNIDTDFIAPALNNLDLSQFMETANDKNAYAPHKESLRLFMESTDFQDFIHDRTDLQKILDDPFEKQKLAQMIRFYMRELLLERGIGSFELEDLQDLDPEYTQAYEDWNTLSELEKTVRLRQTDPANTIFVDAPEVQR